MCPRQSLRRSFSVFVFVHRWAILCSQPREISDIEQIMKASVVLLCACLCACSGDSPTARPRSTPRQQKEVAKPKPQLQATRPAVREVDLHARGKKVAEQPVEFKRPSFKWCARRRTATPFVHRCATSGTAAIGRCSQTGLPGTSSAFTWSHFCFMPNYTKMCPFASLHNFFYLRVFLSGENDSGSRTQQAFPV